MHGGPDKQLTVRDASTGRVLHELPIGGTVWCLSIGPANRCAVSGEFQLVQVVDLESAGLVLYSQLVYSQLVYSQLVYSQLVYSQLCPGQASSSRCRTRARTRPTRWR